MPDISVAGCCGHCGKRIKSGWSSCHACIEKIQDERYRQTNMSMTKQEVIERMLIDLGISKSDAAEDAEMAMERIDAGTPPLLALVQSVLSQAEAIRPYRESSTGLSGQGDMLASHFYELLSWPNEEFLPLLSKNNREVVNAAR